MGGGGLWQLYGALRRSANHFYFLPASKMSFFVLAGGDGEQIDGRSRGKMSLSLIIAIAFTSVIVLIILSSTILYIYFCRRRMANGQGKVVTVNHSLFYQNSMFHLYTTRLEQSNKVNVLEIRNQGNCAEKSRVSLI